MQPIVSPWFIYLLDVIGGIQNIVAIVLILSIICVCIGGVCLFFATLEEDEDVFNLTCKYTKRVVIVLVISCFLYIIVPTRNTLIGMYVAKNITYNRVEKVVKYSKNIHETIKKDIIDIINELNKKDKD